MAEACANRPAVVTATLFADQLAQTQDGHSIKITTEQAVEIHEELITQGYIKKGKLTQKYFDEKKADSLQFGEMEIYIRLSSNSWIKCSIPMPSNRPMDVIKRRLT